VRRSGDARRLPVPRPLGRRRPIERVYDTIGEVLEYDRWWTDFVIRAEGDEGPAEPGKRNDLLVNAYQNHAICRYFFEDRALWRTRTADPLLTMEALVQCI
jgi:hypothetical protein